MKCKRGYNSVKGMCVPNKKTTIKAGAKVLSISYLALIGSLVSIGGWALFTAIIRITKLDSANPWIIGVAGLAIIVLTTIFGWRKLK